MLWTLARSNVLVDTTDETLYRARIRELMAEKNQRQAEDDGRIQEVLSTVRHRLIFRNLKLHKSKSRLCKISFTQQMKKSGDCVRYSFSSDGG